MDISQASGACPPGLRTARNIGVFDYDGDGLLDLLVVEDRFITKPRSVLLRNKGNLQFEDVTKEVGLPDDLFGLGLAVADLNGDGRPDFFVAHSNRLFLSQVSGGKVTYREAVELRGVLQWKPLHNEDWPCGVSRVVGFEVAVARVTAVHAIAAVPRGERRDARALVIRAERARESCRSPQRVRDRLSSEALSVPQ